MQSSSIGEVKNPVNLSKIIFSSLNFHMQIFNNAKYKKDTLKALGIVDFTIVGTISHNLI